MRWSLPLFGLLVATALHAQPADEHDWAGDEAVLKKMNLPTKGPALLQIFRDRTPTPETAKQFHKHVARLDAAPFPERMKANADLLKMGPVVRPFLVYLIADGKLELETKRRQEQILEHFPPENDIAALTSAARLLERDKPADRLPVLLDFVPHVPNELVRQDLQRALNGAALVGKEPSPLILAAFKDAHVARRAAAAEALVRILGPAAAKERIEPLLKDAHPLLRYQIGMALVEKNDKAGLPLLIQTLADASPERVEFALDLLYRAAGESAPTESYQGKKNAEAFNAAWRKWYEKNQAGLDLSKLLARIDFGYTVITTVGPKARVIEIGPHPQNAVRWEFDGPRYPLDVQILGPNRLLLTEYLDRRVTERDFKGNILKQFPANLPIACQRLPNKHTFIVTRQQLQIVDADGQQVFSWSPQSNPTSIMAAQRLKNGQFAVLTSGGLCQLLDPQGKELKRFNMGGGVNALGGNIEVLPNGRILVPLYTQQQVAEFDWSGNKLWQASIRQPTSVTRLPNGNTLVTCSLDRRVVEIDRNGKEVWSYQTEGRPFRARRR